MMMIFPKGKTKTMFISENELKKLGAITLRIHNVFILSTHSCPMSFFNK